MAEPLDKIRVLKTEGLDTGGNPEDADPFMGWGPIDENEDVLSAAGVAVQEIAGSPDTQAMIFREDGYLRAKDAHHATVNLLDMVDWNLLLIDDTTGNVCSDDILGNVLVNR